MCSSNRRNVGESAAMRGHHIEVQLEQRLRGRDRHAILGLDEFPRMSSRRPPLRVRVWVLVVVLVATFLGAAASSRACRCKPVSLQGRYKQADAVVLGRAKTVRVTHGSTYVGRVVVEIERTWKAQGLTGVVTVFTGDTCAFPFAEGESYLLFLQRTSDGAFGTTSCAGNREARSAEADLRWLERRADAPPVIVEIVPGKSIGQVRLGSSVDQLPQRAVVGAPAGELDGVHFVIDSHALIEDIWIEDLRKFRGAVTFAGGTIDSKATVAQLETVFGKCSRIEGVKGGIFYNCAAGVALGTDLAGKTLQVRVKPR